MDKFDNAYWSEMHEVPKDSIITMDGTNTESKTGIINFYTEGIKPERLNFFLGKIFEFLFENGIHYGHINQNESKMFKVPVIRIPILNSLTPKNRPPQLNMANDNAAFIFKTILKYDIDMWTHDGFDPQELKKRIEYFQGETQFNTGEHAGKPFVKIDFNELKDMNLSGEPTRSTYDEYDIRQKLNTLKQICDWAINNNSNKIYLA